MKRSELIRIFEEIYNKMLPLGVSKNIVVNFRIPKEDSSKVFAYCTADIFIDDIKGTHIYNDYDDDFGSEISLNPKLTKSNLECIRNTIAHELIHTIKGCDNHGAKFLRIGKRVKKLLNLENDVLRSGTKEESIFLN